MTLPDARRTAARLMCDARRHGQRLTLDQTLRRMHLAGGSLSDAAALVERERMTLATVLPR